MRGAKLAAALYVLLCVLAWGLVPLGDDGLSGIYVILLALPWSMALPLVDGLPVVAGWGLLVLGMAVNLALILGLGRLLERLRKRRH